MSWITIKTNCPRWEAEFIQQLLAAHQIPSRILDIGITSYFGQGSSAVLQVLAKDQWNALLLLSPIEQEEDREN